MHGPFHSFDRHFESHGRVDVVIGLLHRPAEGGGGWGHLLEGEVLRSRGVTWGQSEKKIHSEYKSLTLMTNMNPSTASMTH